MEQLPMILQLEEQWSSSLSCCKFVCSSVHLALCFAASCKNTWFHCDFLPKVFVVLCMSLESDTNTVLERPTNS